MKIIELNRVEPRYTGKYLIRVGTYYWIPDIRNPHNLYETTSVKGVHKFTTFHVEVEDASEEDVFLALELRDDQVIISMEIL